MRTPSTAVSALLAAVAVLAVGIAFTATRDREYQSFATVVLSPSSPDPERVSGLLESFERSGTLGTYVELMASDDTTREARGFGVNITVRAVPDTRTIRLSAVGREEDTQPALASVIETTQERQPTLADLFALGVLEQPSKPEQAGPGNRVLLVTTVLLAAFAALAVVLLLRQLGASGPSPSRPPSGRRGRAKARATSAR